MENADDLMRNADEAIEALKRTKPSGAAAERKRTAELLRLQQVQLEAARKITDANAAKRISNGSNGAAKPPAEVVATDMSPELLHTLAQGMCDWLLPILKDIQKRLAEVEATQLTDGGVWKADKVFRPGMLTSYRGAIWICLQPNSNARPPNDCWRLMHRTPGGGRDEH